MVVEFLTGQEEMKAFAELLRPELTADGFEPVLRSRLLPDLDIVLLERCVLIRPWQQARRTFRAGFAGNV